MGRSIRGAVIAAIFMAMPLTSVISGDLSEPEKLFEHLWQTYDRNYALFSAKKIDWDTLYRVYRPKVTAQTTNDELFEIMSNLLGHLNDNHVRLRTGESTFQSGILGQMKMEDFSLDLIKEKYLKKQFQQRVRNIFTFGWLTDSIGYFHFRGFGMLEATEEAIDEITNIFRDAKGVVIDVRANGGGDDRVGKLIAGRFADRQRLYMTTQIRNGPSYNDFTEKKYWYVEPDGVRQFVKPVILLTHRFSVSAAENFALAMRVIPHVTVVGDATSGVFADVYRDQLPNGWQFSVSYKLFLDQNGFCWEGIGVPADIRQINTKADIEAKRDRPLELAVALLESGALKPQIENDSLVEIRQSLVKKLAQEIDANGFTAAQRVFNDARMDRADDFYVDEDELAALIDKFEESGSSATAIDIAKLAVLIFPKNYRYQTKLADLYAETGEESLSRNHFGQALAANRRSFPWERSDAETIDKKIAGYRILAEELARANRQDRLPAVLSDYRQEPERFFVDEQEINRFGYQLMGSGGVEAAIEVFIINTVRFPESSNVWDSLGEAYMVQGEHEKAIVNYEKSLQLNPGNDNAKEMISKMRESEGIQD